MWKFNRLLVTLTLFFAANTSYAAMILSFESSNQSWVGQGESYTVSPSDGYIFSGGELRFDNSLSFRIASLNSPFGPSWDPSSGNPYNYWTLDLAAPFDQVLSTGLYGNAARYPFQDNAQAGLTFSGNHRGNNQNSGFFEILDIAFNGVGNVETLAVDFTQFGETNSDRWINGKLRFNSAIPLSPIAVPEPSGIALLGLGLVGLFSLRKKKAA